MSKGYRVERRNMAGEVEASWVVSDAEAAWLDSLSDDEREEFEEFHTAFSCGEPLKGIVPYPEVPGAILYARLEHGQDWTLEWLDSFCGPEELGWS